MIDQNKIDEQMLDHYEKLADEAEEIGHTRSEEAARWVIDVYMENKDLLETIEHKDNLISELEERVAELEAQTHEGYGAW